MSNQTLLSLMFRQAMAGNTKGTIFLHLRALHEVIVKLYQNSEDQLTPEARDMEGLVCETYAYLAIVSNITPYGSMKTRQISLDPFVLDLDYLRK